MNKRSKPLWFMALAVVAGLAWWSSRLEQDGGDIELQTPATAGAPADDAVAGQADKTAAADDWFSRLGRDSAQAPVGDPFHSAKPNAAQTSSAETAPPPPPPPPQPSAPAETTLPFQYLGKLERNGRLDVYLDLQGSPLVAHLGDTLPQGWRLERLDGAGLTFTHLGTQQSRVLSLGANP
ncbi:hypothetical protein FNU76_03065 [Chitinimonas arctica]|uniref:Type II secretion system protein GspC N-terminal domain-containing protein n=1 Tax=Chitinimonas arctica TaxID=2594795 RepID=A0A516SB93_9NEIS|nr:hypothetical protein [Chitinimonas arctica]QDQ25417.1 hypothetical protein FNU76_03065 [Chitinimonas arctica]